MARPGIVAPVVASASSIVAGDAGSRGMMSTNDC